MPAAAARTTLTIRPKARRVALERARAKSISLGDAVSELIEEAEEHRPKTRVELRDGLPVFVSPAGSAAIDPAVIRRAVAEDW